MALKHVNRNDKGQSVMKIPNTLAEYSIEQLEAAIDDFINNEDIEGEIKMRFLEDSAEYLGKLMPSNTAGPKGKSGIH